MRRQMRFAFPAIFIGLLGCSSADYNAQYAKRLEEYRREADDLRDNPHQRLATKLEGMWNFADENAARQAAQELGVENVEWIFLDGFLMMGGDPAPYEIVGEDALRINDKKEVHVTFTPSVLILKEKGGGPVFRLTKVRGATEAREYAGTKIEDARRLISSNNLKQIGLGMLNYEADRKRLPSSAICTKEGKPLLSWRVAILPYVEQGELYQEFRLDEPWDSEHNEKLIARMPATFKVPGAGPIKPGMTPYIVPTGEATVFPSPCEGLPLQAISDGTFNTILCVEAEAEKAVPWTTPDELSFNPRKPHDGVSKSRPQGFFAGFGDGHVQLIPGDTAADVLAALFSPSGGEKVKLP